MALFVIALTGLALSHVQALNLGGWSVQNRSWSLSCGSSLLWQQNREQLFSSWVKRFGRNYKPGTQEYEMRGSFFDQRLMALERHNCGGGDRNWEAVLNHLSDRTPSELNSLLGRTHRARNAPRSSSGSEGVSFTVEKEIIIPESLTYKHLQAMMEIRDQKMCGSCWAEAAATVLRAHSELHAKPRTFSVQQIVACTPNPRECGGKGGCDGATAELAMEYVLQAGCKTEEELPYTGVTGECPKELVQTNSKGHAGSMLGLKGWMTLPSNEVLPLQRSLVSKGPLAVSAAADNSWFMYGSGIKDGCSKDAIVNHAVVMHGFGVDGGKKYWEIQNSWGSSWGEDGHMRLLRPDNEDKDWCGWDNDPRQGIQCKDENEPRVKVCGMCGILYDTVVPFF